MASSSTPMEDGNSTQTESEFDMAVTFLSQLGFKKALIKRTLHKFLKVYGGKEGWVLIKEGGYQVVVEDLISNQKPSRSIVKNTHPSSERASSPPVVTPNDVLKKPSNCETDNVAFCEQRTIYRSSIEKSHYQQDNGVEKTLTSDNGPTNGGKNASKFSDLDSSEVYLHQRGLWTKNGSLAAPEWFREKRKKLSHADSGDKHSNNQKKKQRNAGDGTEMSSRLNVAIVETHKNTLKTDSSDRGSQASLANTANGTKIPDRIDVARMNAFKLTRRRDGCPNTMFQRLWKLKESRQASEINSSACKRLKQNNVNATVPPESMISPDELPDLNNPVFSEEFKNSFGEVSNLPGTIVTDPDVPPGFKNNFGEQSQSSLFNEIDPAQPAGFENHLCELPQLPALQKTEVACVPVFENPGLNLESTCPPQSPELPPGFNQLKKVETQNSESQKTESASVQVFENNIDKLPQSACPSQSIKLTPEFNHLKKGETASALAFEDTLADLSQCPWLKKIDLATPTSVEKNLEGASLMSSPVSPLSPDVPPGFWGIPDEPQCFPTQPPGLWEQKHSYENSRSRVPSTSVFIAGIPGCCQSLEMKLQELVDQILEGFRFIPMNISFPRRISVFGNHAIIEFQSEAMAGIFVDAYRSKPQILSINGEQLLAARTLQWMKLDAQLRRVAAEKLKGEALTPANVFYLGNIPTEWQDEVKLKTHLMSVFDHRYVEGVPDVLSVYSVTGFPDVYVSVASKGLANRFFHSCFSRKDILDQISKSLVISNNPHFLPRSSSIL